MPLPRLASSRSRVRCLRISISLRSIRLSRSRSPTRSAVSASASAVRIAAAAMVSLAARAAPYARARESTSGVVSGAGGRVSRAARTRRSASIATGFSRAPSSLALARASPMRRASGAESPFAARRSRTRAAIASASSGVVARSRDAVSARVSPAERAGISIAAAPVAGSMETLLPRGSNWIALREARQMTKVARASVPRRETPSTRMRHPAPGLARLVIR